MNAIHLFAILLLFVAAGIVLKQRQAKNCSRHSALAGGLAWLLAVACAVCGVLLLALDSAALL